ncbi:hypothetical protein POM88_021926 [Heracleum sosnowskyi]|uniref:Iron-sulphur binding protein LdpA C-terminal domain-containing protein n=1 Tax=Heracleum sosnowskyi TaxID=360622 RepID=A0AAD8IFU5_9APIA|nr:hypothetical protein POM88_021926 [Heracleum sosnowskyi]
MHSSVDEKGKDERVWVRNFGSDLEFCTKLWSRFDPKSGKTVSLDQKTNIVIPRDRDGLYAIDVLDPNMLIVDTAKSGNKNLRSTSPSSTVLIGGVAYGGYARKIVGRILNSMQALHGHAFIEDHPEHLVMALTEALALVGSIKCYPSS